MRRERLWDHAEKRPETSITISHPRSPKRSMDLNQKLMASKNKCTQLSEKEINQEIEDAPKYKEVGSL